jgi:hypothetical protein
MFDESVPIFARPACGVGLLLMAFNSKISFDTDGLPGAQSGFTQALWADSGAFSIGTSGGSGKRLLDHRAGVQRTPGDRSAVMMKAGLPFDGVGLVGLVGCAGRGADDRRPTPVTIICTRTGPAIIPRLGAARRPDDPSHAPTCRTSTHARSRRPTGCRAGSP